MFITFFYFFAFKSYELEMVTGSGTYVQTGGEYVSLEHCLFEDYFSDFFF